MVRIRRFGVIKTATVAALMYAVIILVSTLLIGLPIALLAGASVRGAGFGAGILAGGVVGVLLFGLLGAVIYAVIGWVMTAIACAVYNLVAGWVGGIEVQLESVAAPVTPQWGGPYGGYPQPGYAQQAGYPQPGYVQQPGYAQPGYGPGVAQPPAPGGQPPSQYPPSGFGPG
jgi:hypothetical protein